LLLSLDQAKESKYKKNLKKDFLSRPKINFATKIYRLSPLEKGGNEVCSRAFFSFLEFILSLTKEPKKRILFASKKKHNKQIR